MNATTNITTGNVIYQRHTISAHSWTCSCDRCTIAFIDYALVLFNRLKRRKEKQNVDNMSKITLRYFEITVIL